MPMIKSIDFDEDRMNDAAVAARRAALEVLGADGHEVPEEFVSEFTSLWLGEFVNAVAINLNPEIPLRDAVVLLLDAFLASNKEELAEIARSSRN